MNQRALVVALLGLATTTIACGKKPPVVDPPPASGGSTPTPPPPPSSNPGNTGFTSGGNPTGDAAAQTALRNTLAELIHFDYNESTISTTEGAKLDAKLPILRANPLLRIRVTGHCDERGSDEFNVTLGMRRASAAKDYLVRKGIDPSRIEVASLGREVPMDPASNESAWSRNRRDEFEIIAGGQSLVVPN